LTVIHAQLALTVLYFMIIAGIWGLASALRGNNVTSNYWGILAVGELLILAQAALGLALWLRNLRPERAGIHILYGVVSAITLPAYYAFSKGRDDRTASIIYGMLCLFVAVISLRARVTGG
jgi:hypothetical protein